MLQFCVAPFQDKFLRSNPSKQIGFQGAIENGRDMSQGWATWSRHMEVYKIASWPLRKFSLRTL